MLSPTKPCSPRIAFAASMLLVVAFNGSAEAVIIGPVPCHWCVPEELFLGVAFEGEVDDVGCAVPFCVTTCYSVWVKKRVELQPLGLGSLALRVKDVRGNLFEAQATALQPAVLEVTQGSTCHSAWVDAAGLTSPTPYVVRISYL